MGWKPSDKFITDPQDGGYVAFEQEDGVIRSSTWLRIKNYILGTAALLTTDKTVRGAINENTTSLSDKVNKTAIVNNLTATQEGFVLDARQGKVLSDNFNTLSSKAFIDRGDVALNTNFNTYTSSGFYIYGLVSTNTNPPDAGYGILEVINKGGYILQRATNFIDGNIRTRVYNGSTWTSWKTTIQS